MIVINNSEVNIETTTAIDLLADYAMITNAVAGMLTQNGMPRKEIELMMTRAFNLGIMPDDDLEAETRRITEERPCRFTRADIDKILRRFS